VKGTWSGGSLAGDPEGFVEKALETGIFTHRGPTLGKMGEGSSTGDFEMDEGGLVDELPPSLFEEALRRGPGEDFLHWGR
jgi:hypothetical protein